MKFNLNCYLCDKPFVREISSNIVHKSKRFCGTKCRYIYHHLFRRELRPCLYCWKPLFVEKHYKFRVFCDRTHFNLHKFYSNHKVEGECWIWTGFLDNLGYGGFVANKKSHRFSYEHFIGPIPKGKHILHKCDRRNCVNPKHLMLGTHQDNMNDMVKKGRHAFGERVGLSKLSNEDIKKVRKCFYIFKIGKRNIAKMFDVSVGAIQAIIKGRTWKHIPNPYLP